MFIYLQLILLPPVPRGGSRTIFMGWQEEGWQYQFLRGGNILNLITVRWEKRYSLYTTKGHCLPFTNSYKINLMQSMSCIWGKRVHIRNKCKKTYTHL